MVESSDTGVPDDELQAKFGLRMETARIHYLLGIVLRLGGDAPVRVRFGFRPEFLIPVQK
jgi:hypothetical protein